MGASLLGPLPAGPHDLRLDRAPGAPGASYRLFALTSAGVLAERERCAVEAEAPPAE